MSVVLGKNNVYHFRHLTFNRFSQVHHAKYGDVDVAIKVARSLWSFQTTPAGSVASNVGPVQLSDNVCKPAIDQLLREARLFANLDHKNIIQLYGICSYPTDGYISLVLEYAHGGALSKLLEKRNRGVFPRVFINYAAQIVAGMYYLHEVAIQGIIHRDLKGSNGSRNFDYLLSHYQQSTFRFSSDS